MTTTDHTTFEAVYRNGVLEPLAPVAGLVEGQRVRVQVQRIAAPAEEPARDAALAPWPAEDADEVARWAAYERRVAADLARHLASSAQDTDERAPWPSDPAGDAEWAAYERRVAADLARHLIEDQTHHNGYRFPTLTATRTQNEARTLVNQLFSNYKTTTLTSEQVLELALSSELLEENIEP